MLDVRCVCGKLTTANEDMAGQKINCIRCNRPLQVPELPPPPPEPEPVVVPDIPATKPVAATGPPKQGSAREYLYWLMIFCTFPLAIGLGQGPGKSFEERLEDTIRLLPQSAQDQAHRVFQRIQDGLAGLEELFAVLPERRLEGALLPRGSQMHWLMVLATVLAFWLIISFCFAPGAASPLKLLAVSFFSATVGILLLIILHYFTPTAIFLQVAELAEAGHQPDFLGSLAYFTLAVGLFEEAIKLVPLAWYLYRYHRIEWRMACLWGLASGAGFGISEGAMYAQSFYNGISTGPEYLDRFISCVAGHAVLTASAGLSLYFCQDLIREVLKWDEREAQASLAVAKDAPLYMAHTGHETDWMGIGLAVFRVLGVVMFLHGLYDAALTHNMYAVALAADIAAFGWLAWQIEDARRREAAAQRPASAGAAG